MLPVIRHNFFFCLEFSFLTMQSLPKDPSYTDLSEEWVNRKKEDREKERCTTSLEEAAWKLSQRTWYLWRNERGTVILQFQLKKHKCKDGHLHTAKPNTNYVGTSIFRRHRPVLFYSHISCWNTQKGHSLKCLLCFQVYTEHANAEEMQMRARVGLVTRWPITLLDAIYA